MFQAPAEELRDAYLIWRHTEARVDGHASVWTAASAVVDQSSVGGRWPLPPGDYEVAYLLDDDTRRSLGWRSRRPLIGPGGRDGLTSGPHRRDGWP